MTMTGRYPLATVYLAGKTRLAPRFRDVRDVWRDRGAIVMSTWIDQAGEGETEDFGVLWADCVWQASMADLTIAVHEDGDVWKGTFIEVGAALAFHHPVYVVGRPPGTWIHHAQVTIAESIDDALEDYRARFMRREWWD